MENSEIIPTVFTVETLDVPKHTGSVYDIHLKFLDSFLKKGWNYVNINRYDYPEYFEGISPEFHPCFTCDIVRIRVINRNPNWFYKDFDTVFSDNFVSKLEGIIKNGQEWPTGALVGYVPGSGLLGCQKDIYANTERFYNYLLDGINSRPSFPLSFCCRHS